MNSISKEENKMKKSWMLLGLSFSYMLSIFAPLSAFFANYSEFWFGINQVLPLSMGVFLVLFIFFILLSLLLKNKRCNLLIYSFLLSTYLYLYVQGNYVPRNYGVLNGADIAWNEYTSYKIVSICLIVVSITLWMIFFFKLKEKIFKIGMYICCFITSIQVITTAVLFIQNKSIFVEDADSTIVTNQDMYTLSDNNNIVVFILDTFDSSYFQTMLEGEYEERTKEIFKDFTYYPDTLGAYPTTKASLPFILTGKWYENNIEYSDYVEKAYSETTLYDTLKENNYSIGLYTSPNYIKGNPNDFVNIEEGSYKIKGVLGFVNKLYSLAAFDYLPHQLKRYVYTSADEFEQYKATGTRNKSYSSDVQNFYNEIDDENLNLVRDKNAFRLYHLDGVHHPYTFDINLKSDESQKYEMADEASGCFTLLEKYIDDLKEKNIYDNTTIIIIADHGQVNLSQNPLFMIKNAGETHNFRTSNTKMSFEYLTDMFESIALGNTINEYFVSNCFKESKNTRRYLFYSWDDSWARDYLPDMTEYYFSDSAQSITSAIPSGTYYYAKDDVTDYKYQLGEELSFKKDEANANTYCLYGFSYNEQHGTWTDNVRAGMKFSIDHNKSNLLLHMSYSTYAGNQRVIIYANDKVIADFIANGTEEKELFIPAEYVQGSELTLTFELPNAISPFNLGESLDKRILALDMKKISLSSISEKVDIKEKNQGYYKLGTELTFTNDMPTANEYVVTGFSNNESTFTWTDGNIAEMRFVIDDVNENLLLKMRYGVYAESQRVLVYINDELIKEYEAIKSEEKDIEIAKELIKDNQIHLRLELPDAVSPASRGESKDARLLGLSMQSLKILQQE